VPRHARTTMSPTAQADAGGGVLALALSAQLYSQRDAEELPVLALLTHAARRAWPRLL
jgi:hypothetical protein